MKTRQGGCGRMIINGRYLMTCVGGFLNYKKGSECSTAIGKSEIKLLEENLRRLFVADGNSEVLNDEMCKLFCV